MLPDFKTPLLWLLGVGLVAALGVAGIERTRAAGARADLAVEKRARAEDDAARALAALADLQRTVALVAVHAQAQQENVDAYERKLAVLDGRRRAADRNVERLRKQFADYAAHDREQAATDPAACQRIADRSAVIAGLASRGRELLERGRIVVEARDNEVQLLLGTLKNDRALLESPAPSASVVPTR
ncbi:hypothetical protein EJO66_31145 [Variovorax beijingensis]|uniref:Uncharacterized protein n=1 Tax=Variovorax beijingensis TaxID=2496117 RepID=A0ABX9ZXB1_9BURK|nr:hypothetical protein [Variovorax beijingensis]RSZ28803.1 hypothetical protein EJO66_31145 [Variovorax beijingensis]